MNKKRVISFFDELFMVSHSNHNTIKSMEGLRAFAAFMVFVVHYAAQALPWVVPKTFSTDFILYIRYFGATGVDFFFILSGFLIYGMLISKDVPVRKYIKRRLLRIYPTFIVVMILYLVLSFLFPAESKLPGGVYENSIFIIQSFLLLPGILSIEPIMTVAWTLSYEMFFYLIVPVFIVGLGMRSWQAKHRITFLASIALVGFIIGFETSSYIRMLMFVSGMLVFELKNTSDLKLPFNNPLAILICTFFLMFLVRYNYPDNYGLASVFLMFFGYGLVCFLSFDDQTNLGKIFANRFMRWYGNMSYSYYLIHGLTLKFLFMVLNIIYPADRDSSWILYAAFIPFFAATLIVSVFLFALIEKPFSFGKIRMNR